MAFHTLSKKKEKKEEANIERICMLFKVLLHFKIHSGYSLARCVKMFKSLSNAGPFSTLKPNVLIT